MDLRLLARRWHSPALFALVALCFLLPFGTVSCAGETTTFTGLQLATWTVPDGRVGESDGATLGEQVEDEASLLALFALVASALGLFLGLLRMPRGEGWCAAVGLVTTLALAFQALDSLATTLLAGFLLTLFLFTWTAVLHTIRAVRRHRAAGRPAVSSS